MNAADPLSLIQHSTGVYSAVQVESAIEVVANQINVRLAHKPVVVMCVMSGGLYFCGQLLPKLHMPLALDYVQANRYQHALHGGELVWTKLPTLDLHQKTVLLVDDILDEGITLHGVYMQCLQLGAAEVLTAVLTDKKNNQHKPIVADFVGLSVPDKFVFGCGMDAHGWWRNLPEIRALDVE